MPIRYDDCITRLRGPTSATTATPPRSVRSRPFISPSLGEVDDRLAWHFSGRTGNYGLALANQA